METNLEREEQIFDAVLDIEDADRRRAYLDEACGGDAVLRSRIERLLATHEHADDFFVECAAGMKPTLDEVERASLQSSRQDDPGDDQVGKRVGNYKLLQRIGEGGCGTVYMAEQLEPVRRRVALKIIKLGMDTKQVIARFEAERQALAMMSHPNIARVLEAGATETGRPYFVMELVRGVRITTYCDERNLDTRQRLELFIQVCQSIQHAHQKGIIHRDIKPSNVLVTQLDGMPVPKVIDFGIAKATEAPLTEKTLFTAYGHFVGTPAYMSPEQAQMSGMDVDTRSDIYSLGVLLYELLTGRTPFEQEELLQSGLDELRRTLREKEPHRPSTKLNTLRDTELTATALHRQVAPLNLKSQLSGDLDWIVMKAIEKDRSRRYETANALAMDVQRYLDNEPVVACPPSRFYRFQKLVRRNRVVFASAGAVAVALIVGLGVATWSFVKEREARQRAVAAEREQTRLRREAEMREKVTQARVLVRSERFAEADELMKPLFQAVPRAKSAGSDSLALTPGLKPALQPSLESAAVVRSLAEWYALRRRWSEAADRFASLAQVNQLDGWNTVSMDFLGRGAALLAMGDTNRFDTYRNEVLTHFGQTANPVEAERLLKVCLLKPVPANTVGPLQRLAEVAAPETPVMLTAQSPTAADWRKTPSGSIGAEDGAAYAGVAPDTTPPALLGVYCYDGQTVGIQFNESMDVSSLGNLRNYTIIGTTVTNAIAGVPANSVTLQLATRLPEQFAVTVSGVRDAARNEIPSGSTEAGRVLELRLQDFNTGQPLRLECEGQTLRMSAGGSDIWESADQFGFAYMTVSGDFDYRLHVHSLAPMLNRYTRVGLMARDSLSNASSRHVMVAVNAENSFQVLVRAVTGATTASMPPNPLPTAYGSNSWVRLQRVGTVFHAYTSSDGMDWVQLFQFDSVAGTEGPFADPLYLGIATCASLSAAPLLGAYDSKTTTTATVSELGVTPTVPVNATLALALLEYRRGNYAKAAEWGRRCLAYPEYNAARVATARALLALAFDQLGDAAKARAQLERSRDMIQRKLLTGLDLGGGAHGFWFDWIFADTLLDEAQGLIGGGPHSLR